MAPEAARNRAKLWVSARNDSFIKVRVASLRDELRGRYMDMSRRVPRSGPGPEWPNEPDDGEAYGDQGAQRNGYGHDGNGRGASGQDQRQYGQYGGPGQGAPAGYGQPQSYGGQGGNGYGQQGYAPPGYG